MAVPTALAGDVKALREEIDTLKTRHADEYSAAEALVAKAKADNPDTNVLLEDAEKFGEIDAAYKVASTTRERVSELTERLVGILAGGDPIATDVVTSSEEPKPRQSWGRRFTSSSTYQQLVASKALEGSGAVAFPPVEVASRDELKAHLAATIDGSPLIPVDESYTPVRLPMRRVRLLDLITVGATDTDMVRFRRQLTRTNAAAETAPGTSSPESGFTYGPVDVPVRRIPHHVELYKSQMADQSQLETEMRFELDAGVKLRTENQILAGTGTGENLRGILNTSGIGSQAMGADSIPDAMHKAMTVVRVALEDDITAIGMHPNDYQRLVLAKDGSNNYLTGMGWQSATPMTVWGYPAVVSTAFTEGVALAGAWQHAWLWVRSGVTISQGYIGDQFIQDLITLNAEYRAAFAVKRPQAFCQATGLNA